MKALLIISVLLSLVVFTNKSMAFGPTYCHNKTTGAVIPKPQFGCPWGWEAV